MTDAAREHQRGAPPGHRCRRGEIQALRQGRRQALDQLDGQVGHALGEAPQFGQAGCVAHGQPQAQVGQDDQGRLGQVPHPPGGVLDLHDAPAVIHRGGGHQGAGLEQGRVGAAAADIDVGDACEVLPRIGRGPGPAPGDQALQVRPGDGDDELTRQAG